MQRDMTTYNTNLAAEFYVLSMLHRIGADASLTLGNKKAVDIVVAYRAGRTATIDVKGLVGPYDWPADNIRLPAEGRHFFALVSFEGKIDKPLFSPSAWIVPAKYLKPFIRKYRVRTVISRKLVKKHGSKFLHAWWRIARGRSEIANLATKPRRNVRLLPLTVWGAGFRVEPEVFAGGRPRASRCDRW